MEPFEYAIRKDVRNNPIVREVDAAREREQLKWFGIAGLVLLGLLMLAWQHFELRAHGYDINVLRKQLAAEQSEGRRLMLELERLRTPKRIQDIAVNKLHMIEPAIEDAIVIERVQPAEPPAESVVARK